MAVTILHSRPPRSSFAAAGVLNHDGNGNGHATETEEQSNGSGVEENKPALRYQGNGRAIEVRPEGADIAGIGTIPNDGSVPVDIYVSTSNLIFFAEPRGKGLSIPYAHVTVHAVQRDPVVGVYLQLENVPFSLAGGSPDAADLSDVLEIVIVADGADSAQKDLDVMMLFDAISACSNLNPDPGEEDGQSQDDDVAVFRSTDEIFGSGHEWITAENVDEFSGEVEGEERLVLDPRFVDADEEDDSEGQVSKYRRI